MNYYDVGDRIRLTATFRDSAGVLDSPDVVTWSVKKPDGTLTAPTDVPQSAGIHRATIDIDQEGLWYYRVTGSNNPKAAGEDRIVARASVFV